MLAPEKKKVLFGFIGDAIMGFLTWVNLAIFQLINFKEINNFVAENNNEISAWTTLVILVTAVIRFIITIRKGHLKNKKIKEEIKNEKNKSDNE